MRRKSTLTVFATLLLVIGSTSVLKAQREWIHLGDKHVDGNSDHDKISLGSSEGWFHQLQIRVEDAPVSFKRVVVHFGNGTDEELQFRQVINCRWFDAGDGSARRATDNKKRGILVRKVKRGLESPDGSLVRTIVDFAVKPPCSLCVLLSVYSPQRQENTEKSQRFSI